VRAAEHVRHGIRPAGNLGVMADPEGFVPFYRQEAEAVLLFLTRRTLDGEVALELTAETFAQAWRGWERVRVDSSEEMRGQAQRAAVRRLGIRTPSVHEDDLAAIEDAAGLGEVRHGLAVELAHLSDEQREAVQLRVVEEMPYEEVARRLGVSEPAARARVSRALRALQSSLAGATVADGGVS
jgi:RNA polymerase sigma factor (sigma-70 family)